MAGKLEKTDNKPGMGGETSKLTTLSKAIDAIQDNSKSLETMGKIRFRFKIIIQVLNRNTKKLFKFLRIVKMFIRIFKNTY